MRAHLTLTKNRETVPFNYQESLVSTFHKWLGHNSEHDKVSLYSMSWLSQGKAAKSGLNFPFGTKWCISAANPQIIKKIVQGAQLNPDVAFGMKVKEIQLQPVPDFSNIERFMADTPILVRKRLESGKRQFLYYDDPEADEILYDILMKKLHELGETNVDFEIGFDRPYHSPKKKMSTYKGVNNKGSICPIIIRGDERAKAAAWTMGVGHSTGIGFGAIK
jgi:CRISPR-associated endoribonuclease Cas6